MIKAYFIIVFLFFGCLSLFANNSFIKVSSDSVLIGTPLEIAIFVKIIKNYKVQIEKFSLPESFYKTHQTLYDTIQFNNEDYLRVRYYISSLNSGEYNIPSIKVIFKNEENNNFFIENLSDIKIYILNPIVDTNMAYKQPYGMIDYKTNSVKINNNFKLLYVFVIFFIIAIIAVLSVKYVKFLKNKLKNDVVYQFSSLLKKIDKLDEKFVASELSKLLKQTLQNNFNIDFAETEIEKLKSEILISFNENDLEELLNIKNQLDKVNFNNEVISKEEIINIINKLRNLFDK